jgi:hypothetical protein
MDKVPRADQGGAGTIKGIVWRVLLGLIVIWTIVGCEPAAQRPPEGSLEHIASTYQVSAGKVRAVAATYGVTPDRLAVYGPGHFPENYIIAAVAQIRDRQGYVTKEEVDAIVRGYEVRCEIRPKLVYYIFYHRNVRREGWQPEPAGMVLNFVYRDDPRAPSGLIVDHWLRVNVLDHAGFLTDRAGIEERCLR